MDTILEYFVGYDFAHNVLFLEKGLAKLNSILNKVPELTLKAQKNIS